MRLKGSLGFIEINDTSPKSGGEGTVYSIVGMHTSVAKIYHKEKRTKSREEKLKAMLSSPPKAEVKDQVTWPTDILYDMNNNFMGFVMPKLRNIKEVNDIFSYDKRNDYSFSFYLRVAINLCVAVGAVHESGHVCGDLNPENICVNPRTALVTLVDTDSYHVKSKSGRLHRCSVFRVEYIPAELQKIVNMGEDFSSTRRKTYTEHTDNFALAIHIFTLLMNGCHPYALKVGKGYSYSQFPIDKNIQTGTYVFDGSAKHHTKPPYAPDIRLLPKKLQNMFIKVFSGNNVNNPTNRPTPTEWYDALTEFSNNLQDCNVNDKHQYAIGNTTCPLCECDEYFESYKSGRTVNIPNPGPKLPVNGGRRRPRGGFWQTIGSFFTQVIPDIFLMLLGAIFAVACWAGAQYAISKALDLVTLTDTWWNISEYILIGIASFIPYLIYMFINYIFGLPNPGNDFSKTFDNTLKGSVVLALLWYGYNAVVTNPDLGFPAVLMEILWVSLPIIAVQIMILFYYGFGVVMWGLFNILFYMAAIIGALGFWAGFQIFAQWGIGVVAGSAWWWWFVRLAVIAVAPYIPTGIVFLIDSFTDISTTKYGSVFCFLLSLPFVLIIVGYGGFVLFSMWPTAPVSAVINAVLVCLPSLALGGAFSNT